MNRRGFLKGLAAAACAGLLYAVPTFAPSQGVVRFPRRAGYGSYDRFGVSGGNIIPGDLVEDFEDFNRTCNRFWEFQHGEGE